MAVCSVCGAKLGFRKVMLKGMQYVCFECVKKAGYNPLTWTGNLKTSVADIQARIGLEPVPEMVVTQSIGNIFMIDGKNGLWYAQNQFGTRRGAVHRFSDIISYELLEDGDTQTKGGLGSAVAGGLAFGPLGAIVGASAGKKTTSRICDSMRIRITLNNPAAPVEYVNLLQMRVSRKSAAYKKAYEQAQEILGVLDALTAGKQENEKTEPVSAADEIRKFKALMDDGIITPEEFEAKKKQLLGL